MARRLSRSDLRPHFGDHIVVEERFIDGWNKLAQRQQAIMRKKILLLASNPFHTSLKPHPLKRTKQGVWACYMGRSYRLVYRFEGATLMLHQIGPHGVVDKFHAHPVVISTKRTAAGA